MLPLCHPQTPLPSHGDHPSESQIEMRGANHNARCSTVHRHSVTMPTKLQITLTSATQGDSHQRSRRGQGKDFDEKNLSLCPGVSYGGLRRCFHNLVSLDLIAAVHSNNSRSQKKTRKKSLKPLLFGDSWRGTSLVSFCLYVRRFGRPSRRRFRKRRCRADNTGPWSPAILHACPVR